MASAGSRLRARDSSVNSLARKPSGPARQTRARCTTRGISCRRLPYAVTKFTSPGVRRLIGRWLADRRFDVAVCDFLSASLNFPRRRHSVRAVPAQRGVGALAPAGRARAERAEAPRLFDRSAQDGAIRAGGGRAVRPRDRRVGARPGRDERDDRSRARERRADRCQRQRIPRRLPGRRPSSRSSCSSVRWIGKPTSTRSSTSAGTSGRLFVLPCPTRDSGSSDATRILAS